MEFEKADLIAIDTIIAASRKVKFKHLGDDMFTLAASYQRLSNLKQRIAKLLDEKQEPIFKAIGDPRPIKDFPSQETEKKKK